MSAYVTHHADFVIVGSGIAALRAALELAPAGEVIVLTKAGHAEGNTGWAQGGIAAAVGPDDSPERHAADTLAAGDGLCDERAVEVLVEEGRRYVLELMEWGAAFDRAPDGSPALAREGAHSVRRVLHARDATGREIGRVLWSRVCGLGRIHVVEFAPALDLDVRDGICRGVTFANAQGEIERVTAPATLLATGGAGQVFRETTNPRVASGDGVALAWRAGAAVADLEFVQFHPTALSVPGAPRFLLSEALRGEGAQLVNEAGEAFMTRRDPLGDLAPRDRVSRAIEREAAETGGRVFLSLRHLDPAWVHDRFPQIAAVCRDAGLDLARDPVPVRPAAHYVMGGVWTDLDGRTSIPGLFAAGEVACTGVHGANRLASNSLLEGLVFGARAGQAMRRYTGSDSSSWPEGPRAAPLEGAWGIAPDEHAVRDLMWRAVGVFREGRALASAVHELDEAWATWCRGDGRPESSSARAANILAVARLMAHAALRRDESRGGHHRTDFPARDDERWRRHVIDVRSAGCSGAEARR